MKQSKGAQAPKKDYGRIEDGTYPCRVVQIIDFGNHIKTDFATGEEVYNDKTGEPVLQRKVFVTFEFPTETIEVDGEEKPRWQSKEYTLSPHEKAKIWELTASVGQKDEFDPVNVITKACMASIGSTASGNAKILSTMAAPKGFTIPELQNEPKVFDMDEPDVEVFESLPDWMKERITSSYTYEDMPLSSMLAAPF